MRETERERAVGIAKQQRIDHNKERCEKKDERAIAKLQGLDPVQTMTPAVAMIEKYIERPASPDRCAGGSEYAKSGSIQRGYNKAEHRAGMGKEKYSPIDRVNEC